MDQVERSVSQNNVCREQGRIVAFPHKDGVRRRLRSPSSGTTKKVYAKPELREVRISRPQGDLR
jgi:hypothetical protein